MKIINLIITNFNLLIPVILTIIFTYISVLPYLPHNISNIAPLLGIITAIFWIVNKPELMSWSSVLLVGLLHDFLSGLTIGISCLALLLTRYLIIKSLYKYDGSSIIYIFTYVIFGLLVWIFFVVILRSLIQLEFFDYLDVVFQYLFSISISPIIIFINKFFLNQLKT